MSTYNLEGEVVIRNPEFSSLTFRRPAAAPGCYIDRWYDRTSRNWIVQYKSAEGYQLGASDVVGTREGSLHSAKILAAEVRS